jgi:3-(3-hydroxy-phenyl)propionate hydroxylase
LGTYAYPRFDYKPPTDLKASPPRRVPLVVVGAGPVGLAAAIDARLQGLPVIVFDEDDTVSIGSRAVCYAKRALEILDRLGVGDPLCAKGVSWNVGRTFFRDEEVYRFDLLPEPGHKRPGMINLQQYHLEEALIARARELGADLRFKHKVVAIESRSDHVALKVETPDGTFDIDYARVKDAVRDLDKVLLTIEAQGDLAGAEKLLKAADTLRPEVARALDRLKDVPVDVAPIFVTADRLSPPPP